MTNDAKPTNPRTATEEDPIIGALTTMLGGREAPGVFPGPLQMADALEQIANAIRESYWQMPEEVRRLIDENPATWQDLLALAGRNPEDDPDV